MRRHLCEAKPWRCAEDALRIIRFERFVRLDPDRLRMSDDAVLVTCAYLLTDTQPWVEQSLFLAAIGEARDKGARALEAFAYRYREGTSAADRFLVHRTVFPRDFLADFGFRTLRTAGRIELARLDLGGLQPVEEGAREKVLRVVSETFQPAPAPAPPGGG